MKRAELNAFIYNYAKNDLTRGAVILSGPPESGRSHYVRYDLAPYLKKSKETLKSSINWQNLVLKILKYTLNPLSI